MISPFFFVFIGGVLGAFLRGVIMIYCTSGIALWLVNGIGSFVMGLLQGYLRNKNRGKLKLFLTTGILGSFTTFSAFSLHWLQLMNQSVLIAVMYAICMPVLCILLALIGWRLAIGRGDAAK